jgi:hypothetical protein
MTIWLPSTCRSAVCKRRALAHVVRMIGHRIARPVLVLLQQIARPVRRVVVDQDNLLGKIDRFDAPKDFFERVDLVVDRHQHRKEKVRGQWMRFSLCWQAGISARRIQAEELTND